MKAIVIKFVIFAVTVFFADYLLFTIIGCTSSILGCTGDMYTSGFCLAIRIFFILSMTIPLIVLFSDTKKFMQSLK